MDIRCEEGTTMAAYISLISFAQKGIENIKERPSRLDAVKRIYKSMGAELKQFYLTLAVGPAG